MKIVPIGEFTEPVKTWNPSREPNSQFGYIDLSAIDNANKSISAATPTVGSEAPSRARQLVVEGDVLVSTVRPNLNAVAMVPPELDGATASTGFTVLRPSSELDGRFLFHWVRSPMFIGEMVRKATGASYPAVSDRIVKESKIPAPPLPEQRRIAAILDQADVLCAKRRRVLTHLDALPQAHFSELFGDPLSSVDGLSSKPLRDWIDPERPITYGILKPGPDIADGVPYVRVADMQDRGIRVTNVRRTSRIIANDYRRSTLKAGDLLMSIRGHVGRFAVVPTSLDGANITQDSARLAVQGHLATAYVRAAMESPSVQHWMARRTKGAAVRGINLGDLRELPLRTPSDDLLDAFARSVGAIEKLRETATQALAPVECLFISLQSRAFAGRL